MNGRLTRIDEPMLIDEIRAEHEKLKPVIAKAEESVAPIIAVYRRIYERCRHQPIAADTYPAQLRTDGGLAPRIRGLRPRQRPGPVHTHDGVGGGCAASLALPGWVASRRY